MPKNLTKQPPSNMVNPFSASDEHDIWWRAIQQRDCDWDGLFYYGVCTTKVVCLASCPSREAKREHVVWFESLEEAKEAGYRACKRCKPGGQSVATAHARMVRDVCRRLESRFPQEVSLGDLAMQQGVSSSYLHRVFKRLLGVTPKEYGVFLRDQSVRDILQGSPSVTEALYEAGYNTSSRFYERATAILGMKPVTYRNKGERCDIWFGVGESQLGSVLVGATELGVCAILIGDDPEVLLHDLEDRFKHARFIAGDARFERHIAHVVALVENPWMEHPLPLDLHGTAFQQRVWKALRLIPSGQRRTYTDVAKMLGSPSSVRAVANACGKNPLAIAVPCHRVVRTDGSLSGYRWGIERKESLLDQESEHQP